MPKIYFYDSVTSTLDKIVELAKTENLNVWDSVLAKLQTRGRGQMRRKWNSQAGNIFGAINLPTGYVFATTAASVAAGAFFVLALNKMGFNVKLKWPNDLAYEIIDNKINVFSGNLNDPLSFSTKPMIIKRWAKIGGILLEEKTIQASKTKKTRDKNKPDITAESMKILTAGIGINLVTSPTIRSETSLNTLQPGHLYQENRPENLAPPVFWERLMQIIQDLPEEFFKTGWHEFINEYLLWKDEKITFRADSKDTANDKEFKAIIRGINEEGALLLETKEGISPELYGHIIKSPFWT